MNGKTDEKDRVASRVYKSNRMEKDRETTKDLLWQTSGGELIFRHERSIIVELPPGRKTLTTSWLNGGYREDIRYIYNHQVMHGSDVDHEVSSLEGGSISAYAAIIAEELGLEPLTSTGLMTAANMKNVAITTHSFRNLEVTAVITGGIEVNGGRPGDPASYYQENGQFTMIPGTINTILIINANVPHYAMVNAVTTASEAKAVAVQELMAPSQYSNGIATGSGTDMIAVVSDNSSSIYLDDAGKHSKLGELIGKCVTEATKKALAQQSDLTPYSQCNMLVRLERFGIDENRYWKEASSMTGENRKSRFIDELKTISKDPALVSITTSVLHIVDEISWGLLPETAGKRAAFSLIKGIPEILPVENYPPFNKLLNEKESILDNWVYVTAWIIKNGQCAPDKKFSDNN
ncbi:adenosylcobinamide amidohydrolase [Methanolobus profundi]|uniref:Adenosylcobinamide hydrolase n=1 Tax=Methanolobus profundi TaxID=487685 RepID=A0A1I4PHI8_9EURY|nr:adenosylcobinamide amidohydrolase [Methanolobus profundi]SFM27080.1 adenosylcobinamide hydrolase [Methanolobus profundi]